MVLKWYAPLQCGAESVPRLVAVSKTHGVERVQWAYSQGLRHFGENYVSQSIRINTQDIILTIIMAGERIASQVQCITGWASIILGHAS